MIKMMIMSLSNVMNINFIKLSHPMSMMLFIILQTFLVGLMTGTMMESYWLSYILFLTFLGGMLVLFIYITSIASNEMFQPKSITMIITLMMWVFIMSMLIILDMSMFMDFFKNTETMNIDNSINYQEMTMSLEKLYNSPTFIITMMMMIYLFLALLAVVKITNINQGPIRKMS
ncbi:NADH dehydrogenase subunit 6 (mitochondrion) [Schistocerca gregaria]|uniref:NADH-ubiquinone oxidoreductase chain 6 n=3 Tax=Schistocerca gregaria TaxID=7010 RepID=A0AA46MF00_SCHGR|nr:NADH dehydrogenase subunit 6 [Schistocerca gregaria gregaria]YP_010417156.1 NADH dehydrogenase subunit 6 [Schistocerca gregaria]ACX69750.1 NADH dehydrogenase subunit 6 [Schistocerca gregaria flaviventris]ACV41388.1 NADH dehydrogenase subunit 6 [Schistocerca gregaria gregaria]QUS93829.1 NADH dehydrogenase subunit 6 [Schistocerca gregaria]USF93227.1 NADH dehydrogenase subunit 6 [Schistocerca gregaria]